MVSARACLCAAYFLCVRARFFVSMKMAFIEGLRHASLNAPSHSAGDPAFIHSIMPTSSGLLTVVAQDSLHVSAQDQVKYCTSPECDTICMCAQATNIVRSFAAVGSRAPDKAIPAAILDGAAGFAILSVAKVCARFAPLVAMFQDPNFKDAALEKVPEWLACREIFACANHCGQCLICWSPAASRILIGGHPGCTLVSRSQDGCIREFNCVSWRRGCCYC